MTEDKDPLLLDHEVDGIRELDNKLPRWWVWLFYLSILFGVIYLSVYHVFAKGDYATKGQMQAEYQAEMKDEAMMKALKEGVKDGEKVRMKAAEGLSEDEMKALVKFVRDFKK
jgi:cbb3-type cytochrome c oxidase subunit III